MDNPYLQGPYAPVEDELDAVLNVTDGELPRELAGAYVRNGPNPRFAPKGRYHWFDGDGMLHAVRFEDGTARYRNRYVRTRAFERETEAGESLWTGLMEPVGANPKGAPYKDTSNTDVVLHGDHLVSLWYITGSGYRVDPMTLETRGTIDRGGEPVRMSAHAKVDEATSELLFFDYGPRPPFLRYGVVGASGEVEHLTEVDLPGPRLPHDMAYTEQYAILMDLPVFFRPEAMKQGRWLVDFHRELPARFGVLPRRGSGDTIRWFEASPCYVYHVVNAWEEGDTIKLVACRFAEPIPEPDPADGPMARMLANLRLDARMHEWTFDLATGETKERPLDDDSTEFPVINAGWGGRPNRYAYNVHIPQRRTLTFDGLVKYDLRDGTREHVPFGDGVFGSEAAFAPRPGSTTEDDGWVVTVVTDAERSRSQCWVFDAQRFGDGPVAKLDLPRRVPNGFHGTWVPWRENGGRVSS